MTHLIQGVTCVGGIVLFVLVTSCHASRYVQVRGGISGVADADHEAGVESDTFPGPVVAIAGGVELADGLRTELEFSYREHKFGDFTIDGAEFGGSGGYFGYALMANAIYDFDTQTAWRPYFGLGVGAARVGYDIDAFGGRFVDDTDEVFAVQALAGISHRFDDAWAWSPGYRLLVTEDPIVTDELDRRFASDFVNQSIEVGVSYSF